MVIAGKYRLEEALASGGMGSVWRARHLGLDTTLAVKFISAATVTHRDARLRFEREAKAAALLQSPHVVHIHDYGVEGDVPYLVMELLIGEDLGARLKREKRLSLPETVSIVTQVARALRRAAEAGIIHRDLKPGNIFIIDGEEDEALVKVLDFGIAKTQAVDAGDDSTKTGMVLGSPRYLSPEQARGSKLIDPRSDLWSLAVIAYRALTGQVPFQSTDMAKLINSICFDTPISPSQLQPTLGPEIDAFFVRALERDPERRFQTAREMAVALAVATGEPSSTAASTRLRPALPSGEPTWLDSPEPVDPAERVTEPDRGGAVGASGEPTGGLTKEPICETTRLSEPCPSLPIVTQRRVVESITVPEPASRRVPTPLKELTSATYLANLEVLPFRSSQPAPQPLVRGVTIGAGIVVVLGALLLLAEWNRSGPTVGAPDRTFAPPAPPDAHSAPPDAQSALAPPAAPTPTVPLTSAPREAPIEWPPAKRLPARQTPNGTTSKKTHGILGI
jgi:serine/threonine-protein kinase